MSLKLILIALFATISALVNLPDLLGYLMNGAWIDFGISLLLTIIIIIYGIFLSVYITKSNRDSTFMQDIGIVSYAFLLPLMIYLVIDKNMDLVVWKLFFEFIYMIISFSYGFIFALFALLIKRPHREYSMFFGVIVFVAVIVTILTRKWFANGYELLFLLIPLLIHATYCLGMRLVPR